ncbi:nucleotidyltransferase [Bradyrhizobium sp. SZCCHNS3051]|uniref:nucleotidyltransferase domain-containing protein n=1 Tax=Bradyrhizobium sp. SZCCHNS3051 TaxID=3057320 RepID=UPI0029161A77|nr:nucleotidyltransferase [Bradyrhizobium sp. SZCCHNS3051]
MLTLPPYDGLDPFEDPLDRLLAQIAIELQLPPSLFDQAGDRYAAVRRKLEGTSAFAGLIEHFYPQGSMAIDATISIRGTDDEYDLDIVAQLGGYFRNMAPLAILIELEKALVDYPVQRITRQTRCVTLHYADKMHLDITPGVRVAGTTERESYIMHAKGPKPSHDDRLVDMNAYAFACWYQERTPLERRLAKSFDRHWRGIDEFMAKDEAEVDDVPDQMHFSVKNTATLALQLIKRFRNIRYADYSGRIPPSVVLSYYAALSARPNMRLSEMVIRIANWILRDIEAASMSGKRLHVANPMCPSDVFTDRWPQSVAQQNEFAGHLKDLVNGLEAMAKMTMAADAIGEWLREMFGDRVVTKAADSIAIRLGTAIQKVQQSYSRKGRLLVPGTGRSLSAAVAPQVAPATSAKAHTFFGVRF